VKVIAMFSNPPAPLANHLAASSGQLQVRDLGHTGTTLAAASAAGIRKPMARMGHAGAQAALIYARHKWA
jgi:hypothetical protein